MRLAALLAELPVDQLERLAAEHLGQDENISRAALCTTLEGVLRSYSFVRKFVGNRFAPTFAILETLLDADGYCVPAATFREAVTAQTQALVERVRSGELVGRDQSLRLYRRVLLEARRNDLVLDASETAILGVLRRELGIRPVEHFLIEHHPDFHELWAREDAFLDEMHALRSCGLVFGHESSIVLAEEVVPLVRQTLGFEMSAQSRRRLYSRFTAGAIGDILAGLELKVSGSREEKLERLVASYVQPSEVLRQTPHLKELCRELNISGSGSKDDLVERIVDHFLHNLDIRVTAEEVVPVREPEPRELDAPRFTALFSGLKGDYLTDILVGIDSTRVTGAKETKVALLVASPYSEVSLLEKLANKALEDTLARLRLRVAGSKRERVDRLIEHYRTLHESLLGVDAAMSLAPTPSGDLAEKADDAPEDPSTEQG